MMVMMMMMKAYKIMMVDTTGFRAADPGHADNTKKAGWENVLEPLCFFLGPFVVMIMRMNNGMMVQWYNYDLNIMMISTAFVCL